MYFHGQTALPVKPIQRRTTWTRPVFAQNRTAKYLSKPGRKPMNRRGYPAGSTPAQVGTALPLDMSLEPGRSFLGAPVSEAFKVPLLTSQYSAQPSVVATTDTGDSFWNPFASLVQAWNERPQVLKDIKVRVNPSQVMQAAQQIVKPGQVSSAVDLMRSWGFDPTYKGMPVSGQQAGWAYQASGIDWGKWLPWVLGGGVAIIALPMLMNRR